MDITKEQTLICPNCQAKLQVSEQAVLIEATEPIPAAADSTA